jgi:hypothetical protein
MNGGINAPLEGDDVSAMGGFRALVGNAEEKTVGQTFIDKTMGEMQGGPVISQADAVTQLKTQNYDTTGIPDTGITQGALLARMNRASYLRQTQDDASRAHSMGSTSQFVAGLAGGLGDPLNAVIALAGVIGAGARLGLGLRAAVGAAEGVIYSGASDTALNHMNMGDPDIDSAQRMRDLMFGAGVGAILHSSFGPRPVAAPGGGPVTLDMIDKLGERSDVAAKAMGTTADNVVSPKGATGRYQIMPDTARQYGATDAQIKAGLLRDPTFNKNLAQKILDDLNGRYPNDPEAVSIAYNAGPGVANRFIRSGRDYSILPKETMGYVQRINGMPREARINAAQTAYAQMDKDSVPDVKPIIDTTVSDTYKTNPNKIQDEHDLMVSQLHTEAYQAAMPVQDSIFTEGDDVKATLNKIDQSVASVPPAQTEAAVPANDQGPLPPKPAVDPELAQLHANDVADAKKLGPTLGPEEEGKEPALFEPPEPYKIDGLTPDEHRSAVEAAVRCGLLRGGFE